MIIEAIEKAMSDYQKDFGGIPTTLMIPYSKYYQLVEECSRDETIDERKRVTINGIFGLEIRLRKDLPEDMIMVV